MMFKSPVLSLAMLAGMIFSLSACQEKKDEAYYMAHTEVLKDVMHQCANKTSDSMNVDAKCAPAYRAAVQLTQLSQAFIASQTDFGQRILHAQIRAVDLAEQLAAAKASHASTVALQQQLARQQQQVNNLRAVVAMFVRV